MSRSPDVPARRRSDAYFAASFEVARRLAEGRGEEAVGVLRRELDLDFAPQERSGLEMPGDGDLPAPVGAC